jgi:hypothetical protein
VQVNASAAPYVGVWDSGTFGPLSLTAYPSAPAYPNSTSVIATWGLDKCTSNNAVLAANSDGNYAGFPESSAAFNASWAAFATFPSNVSANGNGGTIACNDPNHILFAPTSLVPSRTANGGGSWTAISISGVSNWSPFQQNNAHSGKPIAADRGSGSTTYDLFLNGTGFYISADNGVTWPTAVSYTTGSAATAQVKTPDGQAGDFWFAGGQNSGGGQQMPCGTQLLHYYSGSLHTISNAICPYSIGFGYNSGGYPAAFLAGFVIDADTPTLTISGTGSQSFTVANCNLYAVGQAIVLASFGNFNATGQVTSCIASMLTVNVTQAIQTGTGAATVQPSGIFESDNASTGTAPTWTLKAPFPCNSLDSVQDISGDPSIHGRWYVTFLGTGSCYGSYLLNRDLDPANSNDNSPVGLGMVG